MEPGDVIYTPSLKAHFDNGTVRGWTDWKAGKGKQFVLVLLGVRDAGQPFDAKAALEALGYVPEVIAEPNGADHA